jgi:hypothetical protein
MVLIGTLTSAQPQKVTLNCFNKVYQNTLKTNLLHFIAVSLRIPCTIFNKAFLHDFIFQEIPQHLFQPRISAASRHELSSSSILFHRILHNISSLFSTIFHFANCCHCPLSPSTSIVCPFQSPISLKKTLTSHRKKLYLFGPKRENRNQ